MKISIDNILGSARKIKGQTQLDDDSSKRKKELKIDSVSINNKIASKIDKIDNEIKEIQVSITKNQIINNGIIQLLKDPNDNNGNQQDILENVLFKGKKVGTISRSGIRNRHAVRSKNFLVSGPLWEETRGAAQAELRPSA